MEKVCQKMTSQAEIIMMLMTGIYPVSKETCPCK
jgi:hypothetical protein